VLGQAVQSASDIRKMYLDGNDNDRNQIIADLYGTPDPELKNMFDQRLGVNAPQEGIIYGQEKIFAGDNPVTVMRENRIQKIRENIQSLQKKLQQLRESQDYIDERGSRKI
jgi:tryptophanyl-tRNA synthetase